MPSASSGMPKNACRSSSVSSRRCVIPVFHLAGGEPIRGAVRQRNIEQSMLARARAHISAGRSVREDALRLKVGKSAFHDALRRRPRPSRHRSVRKCSPLALFSEQPKLCPQHDRWRHGPSIERVCQAYRLRPMLAYNIYLDAAYHQRLQIGVMAGRLYTCQLAIRQVA
jgi:hypothetical protein